MGQIGKEKQGKNEFICKHPKWIATEQFVVSDFKCLWHYFDLSFISETFSALLDALLGKRLLRPRVFFLCNWEWNKKAILMYLRPFLNQ